MSALSEFRDHARAMATAVHTPDCQPLRGCGGCVTDADRRLWTQLAAEATDRLERRADVEEMLC